MLLLDYDARRIERRVRFSQRGYHTIAATLTRPEINKQNLVLNVINDSAQFAAATHDVRGSELAFENRVLQMVAETAQCLKDFPKTFFIRNVVTD